MQPVYVLDHIRNAPRLTVFLDRPEDSRCPLPLIARQHAMHAERVVAMANLSVRPSVRPSNAGTVSKQNGHIVTLFDSLAGASFYFFKPQRHYKIPRRIPSAGALNTHRSKSVAHIALYLGNGTR